MTQTDSYKRYGLWILDMVSVALSYYIATCIRFSNGGWGNKKLHYAVMIVMLFVCTGYAFISNAPDGFLKRGAAREFWETAKHDAATVVISLFIVFFLGWTSTLSRQVILNFIWIYAAMNFVLRCVYKKWLLKHISSDKYAIRLLVVTPRDKIDAIVRHLHKGLGPEYSIVGCVSIDEVESSQKEPGDLTGPLTQIPFDEVFVYAPDASQDKVYELIAGFNKMGVPCHYSLNAPTARTEIFGGCAAVIYGPVQPKAWQLAVKRLLDILGGLVGSFITLILTVIIGPMIKLESPGPVFFSQTRVGRNGRLFKIWKFRSMYQDAEARKKELEKENEVKGLMFKMENDPRITKVGAFLRKTSLDEFPQFFNVLKGDMSLVGTRPPTVDEFERYNEHYRRRLSMTPGLTGMWQVSGRSDIADFDEVVKLDLEYIDNWSIRMDIGILFKTVGVLLTGKGAK